MPCAVRCLLGILEVDDSAFCRDWGWHSFHRGGLGGSGAISHARFYGPDASRPPCPPLVGLEDGLRLMAAAWRERGEWPAG